MAGLSNQAVNWAVSSASIVSIVDRGWGFISPNTEILVFMFCGVIGTLLELAGYWPVMKVTELFEEDELRTELKSALYKVSDGVDTARLYSVHIYLAAYILLPYPLLTEKQNVLLTPWLLCGVLRSVLLSLLSSLVGLLLCASYQNIHYPCLQYCVFNAAEFSISLFVWTSVHNFYYYLDSKHDVEIKKVLKNIHRAGTKTGLSRDSEGSLSMLSIDNLGEEEGYETSLVERAAMAWIAREILESGGEYLTDSQFSQYLTLKATMELRQVLKELAERKQEAARSTNKRANKEERVRESLEFCMNITKYQDLHPEEPKDTQSVNSFSALEAFEESVNLSRRDPLRRIPPLTSRRKPFLSTDSEDSGERSVEVQTEPPGPGLALLMETLERNHAQVQDESIQEAEPKTPLQ